MVGHDPVFEAKKRILNRFELCVVTFERAKQLIKGARPRTNKRFNSPVTTALEEIAIEAIKAPETGEEWQLN